MDTGTPEKVNDSSSSETELDQEELMRLAEQKYKDRQRFLDKARIFTGPKDIISRNKRIVRKMSENKADHSSATLKKVSDSVIKMKPVGLDLKFVTECSEEYTASIKPGNSDLDLTHLFTKKSTTNVNTAEQSIN